jgi:hypothetical protein
MMKTSSGDRAAARQRPLNNGPRVGEVRAGLMEITRVVEEDPLFLLQLPPDWKP